MRDTSAWRESPTVSEPPLPASGTVQRVRVTLARWLPRMGWAVSCGTAALLVFAYTLPQDLWSTRTSYLCLCAVAFLVRLLQFQIGMMVLLLGICAALCRRRSLAIASLAVGLVAVGPALWGAIPSRPPAAASRLRLMSVNLNADNGDIDAIDRQVIAANPDIVVTQEFTNVHPPLTPRLAARFLHVELSSVNEGVAVYSKVPLRISSASARAELAEARATRFEIEVEGAAAALYVVHLQRFRSLSTLQKGRLGLATVLKYAAADPLPVIIAGDFNFTEETPNAAAIRRAGFRSCHSVSGQGLAVTRPLSQSLLQHLVGFRIDHVFIEAPLTSTRFAVGGATGSDHFPIIADIALGAVR